jgi:hypothetical protein
MADVKISDLVSANVVNKNDLFLLVQDDSSKNVSAGTLFSSITDPTLSGNIFIGGNVQTLSGVGTVSITSTRTDLYGGVSADATAIANGSVLPSTIYLYTEGKSASGRGLQFANGAPFFKTIYVQHVNGKINLSLGANATGTLNHAPESWLGTTGLRPFNDGLNFVKGAAYTFDVSHPTNAGNIIGLSTSIDGTNTLGTEYTAGVTRTGNPGNAGATVEFTPANVSIDPGGKNYLDIPKGVDGQLKVINLVSTGGGQFVISSNIQNNLAIELRRAGDSAFLMYSGNAWILVGSNPGLQTSFSGTSDDIPEGQKLYFTNARARAAISVPDNTLIYNATTGSIRANVLTLSNINLGNLIPNSDSIPEGAVNLYYSNARVHANLRLASINALLDVDTVTIPPQAGYGLIWNGVRWIPNVITATALTGTVDRSNISESANVANLVLSLSNFTTANLAESVSNLYYSNDRVFANLSLANINVLADVDTVTVAPAYGDALSWNGNTWVPSVVNATNALTANLANLVSSLSNFTTANLAEGTNLYYTNARVYANVSPLLALKANVADLTTSNIAELNSLYYTNARVYSNLSLASINALADVDTLTTPPSSGQALAWNGSAWIPTTVSAIHANTSNEANVANTVLSLSNFTTSNLAEGTNLYYTNARVYANVIGLLNSKANVTDLTTANVAELNNLYYTNARVYANVIGLLNTKANVVDLTTANVLESAGNLYFTNVRVYANVIPLLDLKANVVDLTTANVLESAGNLYFTNARVYANVAPLLALKANVVDLTTANVLESAGNLYYTDARVYANLSLANINVLRDVEAINPTVGQVLYWSGNAWIANNIVIPFAEYSNIANTVVSVVTSSLNANTANIANLVLSLSNFTTANLTEGSQLYYTNARVNAQVESNLRLKANVVDLTTANVAELNNLYYTNDRVYANVTDRLSSLNMNLVPEGDEIHDLGSPTNKWRDLYLSGFSLTLGNTKITSGAGGTLSVQGLNSNSSITTRSITSNVWNNIYTANVIETAGNLYYTNARVRSTLSGGTGVTYDTSTGQISIGQNVSTSSNVTFNDMTLTGNLNVIGNVVGFYANTLIVNDPLIQLGYNNPSDSIDLGFIGHYSDGTQRHAGVFRDATDKKFKFFENLTVEPGTVTIDTANTSFRLANIVATTFEGNVVGNVTGFVSTISNFSTSNLVEGTQLYYTNARVDAHVDPKLTTANVVELNNLYYSNDRVESYVNPKLTTANVIESSNNLYYSNARVLSNIAQMSINVFADVDVTGITANGTLIWNGTSFIAGVSSAAQAANTSQTANVANTVLSIDNFTTSNLTEGTNLYFTNARVSGALTNASELTTANLTVTHTLNARANVGVTLGTASQGNLISNAITMTVNTTVTNGIAQLNEILGKLVPTSPPTFPGNGFIAVSTLSSYRMANFAQTDNTSSGRNVGPANVVSVVRRVSSYITTTMNDMGPGNSGTLTLYKNSASAGSRALGTGSDNGTYSDLIIGDNVDYATKTGQAGGFWESFDANASGTVSAGWNEVYINHSQGGSSNVAFWYYDSSSPGAVVFSVPEIYPSSNTYANSSTVPHYTSATVFTMTANVKNLSGDMYPTSNTFITGSSATGFGTPSSLNYESAGVTNLPLPLTRNLYVTSGNALISTTVNIASGFGSTSSAPTLTGLNSYVNGTGTFTLGATVLYKTPTVSSLTTMEESNIFVQANVGLGSGYGARIINPGSTDNPTQSASASLFNSNTSSLLSYDATIVAANCKHDQTNYSVGYLPVGPNLSSGRSGAQYYTFRFVRTSVSKFNIQFTGQVAGMWVALPGSSIDTTAAPTNGWIDMSTAAITSGVPGTGTGGNGSAGCALGGTVTLNSQGTQSKTCTFGTGSSSSSATNEIYVRIKLTSGQGITALAILGASN